MAQVALFGDPKAFNIRIFDMAGGGYYAVLYDGNTQVFQRRNSSAGQDTQLFANAQNEFVLDHFTKYTYDAVNKVLTLFGATTLFQTINFTRTQRYKFIAPYVIQDEWQIDSDKDGGSVGLCNWNYYQSANAIFDIDNTNLGDATSLKAFGIGAQLVAGGSVYGVIADNNYNNFNNNIKRALASVSGIAAIWVTPNDAGQIALTQATNQRQLVLRQYFFKSDPTLYNFMLQAQLAVAAAIGVPDSDTNWEKILKATAHLNAMRRNDLSSLMLIPSSNYINAMYMRDSFWQSFALDNSIEQLAIAAFESGQNNVSGQIPERVQADGTFQFHKEDSTLLYIIRGYYDRIKRGLNVSDDSLLLAHDNVIASATGEKYTTDATDSGRLKTWMDGFIFTSGTYNGYLQGLYCVALKCLQKLGFDVSNTKIINAVGIYQSLYSKSLGFIKFASDKNMISPDVLVGEALSIFLFNEKMLSEESVKAHLTAMVNEAWTAYGTKVICDSSGGYIPTNSYFSAVAQGDYQNGGSWFLYEYLAFYCGLSHNFAKAGKVITDRINVEIAKDPVSHEYLQTAGGSVGSEAAIRHGYSWNAATCIIKQPFFAQNQIFATKRVEKSFG